MYAPVKSKGNKNKWNKSKKRKLKKHKIKKYIDLEKNEKEEQKGPELEMKSNGILERNLNYLNIGKGIEIKLERKLSNSNSIRKKNKTRNINKKINKKLELKKIGKKHTMQNGW